MIWCIWQILDFSSVDVHMVIQIAHLVDLVYYSSRVSLIWRDDLFVLKDIYLIWLLFMIIMHV